MEKQFNGAANKGGVYRIRNKVNGKSYVGSTYRFKKRVEEHEYLLKKDKHYNKKLQHAWDKYKEEAFAFEVLEVVEGDKFQRTTVEQKYLSEIKDWRRCYNIKKEAIQKEGPWSNTPEETRKKLSEISKGRKHTQETKKKCSEARKGKKHTKEAKKKISEIQSGKRIGKLNSFYGKHHTEETKKKISEACKGKPSSSKTKFKKGHVPLNKGKQHTEEAKRKMREAKRKRKIDKDGHR